MRISGPASPVTSLTAFKPEGRISYFYYSMSKMSCSFYIATLLYQMGKYFSDIYQRMLLIILIPLITDAIFQNRLNLPLPFCKRIIKLISKHNKSNISPLVRYNLHGFIDLILFLYHYVYFCFSIFIYFNCAFFKLNKFMYISC